MIREKVNKKLIEEYFEKKREVFVQNHFDCMIDLQLLVSSLVTIAQSNPVTLPCKRHSHRKKPHFGQDYNCYK